MVSICLKISGYLTDIHSERVKNHAATKDPDAANHHDSRCQGRIFLRNGFS